MTTATDSAPLDVAIIGAGPAGSAAAAILHDHGVSVRVLEATRFPRFVIGESLLPHCMDILEEARLLDAVKACNFQVKNGALFYRGNSRCSFSFAEQHTPGWSWTWQVPRAEFDRVLADTVAARGVPFDYEHKVTAASFDGGRPRLAISDAHGHAYTLAPRFVIDASGYGRVLPRLLDLDAPSQLPTRTALFAHVRGDRRPPGPDEGRIWICVHPAGGWIWIIPFSDGVTSVGAVGTPEFFARFPGHEGPAGDEARLRAILASDPAAQRRLDGVTLLWPPRTLTGYSASITRVFGPGFCLVGNATEFLDPVFSSGVTLALESASRAAHVVARQLRGERVDWEADYGEPMRRGVDVFRTFVTRWYDGTLHDIFFASRHDATTRAQLCSVLAGYVWDESNPIVRQHARRIPQLARLVRDSASP